jgi:hypothetical protein
MTSLGEVSFCAVPFLTFQITGMIQDGELPYEQQQEFVQSCVTACAQVYLAEQRGIREAATKKLLRLEKEAQALAACQ